MCADVYVSVSAVFAAIVVVILWPQTKKKNEKYKRPLNGRQHFCLLQYKVVSLAQPSRLEKRKQQNNKHAEFLITIGSKKQRNVRARSDRRG